MGSFPLRKIIQLENRTMIDMVNDMIARRVGGGIDSKLNFANAKALVADVAT